MSLKLSIVICCWNKWNFTQSCLKDLSHLPKDTHEIIVIDNGSTDETQAKLTSPEYSWIKYVRNETNLGFAKASNIGYQLSLASNVLFLNNDIKIKSNHSNWTDILIDNCDEYIVGPTMGQLDSAFNFVQEANRTLDGNSYMSGWCVASSKKIWNRLIQDNSHGPFSEEYFCYYEDTDASFTARKLSIPFKVVSISVVHFGKQTSSQLNTHKLYTEARKIFVEKWKDKI